MVQEESPVLSIVVPGIRCERWLELYQSIAKSLESNNFELILVGPWKPIHSELTNSGVKFISSYRSPNACQQIGAMYAEGKYIKFEADDCLFTPHALRATVDALEEGNADAILTKYGEGGEVLDSARYMYGASYPSSPYIDPTWVIFNSAIYKRKFFESVGGFDCRFDVPCLGHADIGARIWRLGDDNRRLLWYDVMPVCSCTHLPNRTGDHWAIHDSQQQYDEPLFRTKWNQLQAPSSVINFDNWKKTEKVWKRRFG
jgi:hypothetical protein